jgi:hypothetical protein
MAGTEALLANVFVSANNLHSSLIFAARLVALRAEGPVRVGSNLV